MERFVNKPKYQVYHNSENIFILIEVPDFIEDPSVNIYSKENCPDFFLFFKTKTKECFADGETLYYSENIFNNRYLKSKI